MPNHPGAPGCNCGLHRHPRLTRADLVVLAAVFGFGSVEEFGRFVGRINEMAGTPALLEVIA